jgi:D-aminopeptidase
MKLYIVADMEGATGVTHRDQLLDTGGERYRAGCRMLTSDINAVVEGAVSEGVKEDTISEGHAKMRNVLVFCRLSLSGWYQRRATVAHLGRRCGE